MNHSELCDVPRPLGAIGRHHDIPTRPSKPDQGPKCAGTSTRTGPTNSFVPEPSNDSSDDFSVSMSADEHVQTSSSIPERSHQLLGMPKRENDVSSFPIQPVERFGATSLPAHRPCDAANDRGTDRRHQGEFHPLFSALLQTLSPLSARHSAPHSFTHW